METLDPQDIKEKMKTFHKKHNEDMNYNCKKCNKKISAHLPKCSETLPESVEIAIFIFYHLFLSKPLLSAARKARLLLLP